MRGLACALRARPKNLFANPKKKSHRLGESAPCSAILVPLYTSSAMRHSSSLAPPSAPPTRPLEGRATVRGKFLFVGDQELYVRGVTYGAFEPDADGREYRDLGRIDRDFAQMAASGINAV